MQFYSDEQIEKVYKMEEAIRDVKSTLEDLNNGHIINTERSVLQVPESENTMLYMPCLNVNKGYSTIKTISIFPENSKQGKAVSQGVTLVSELKTGEHHATLSSSYLTRLRTGAMSGIATDSLANHEASVLAVIGTGGMAYEQVLGVLAVRNITKIKLYNRTIEKAYDFKKRLEDDNVKAAIDVCESSREAVQDAHIINCATKSHEAVFDHKDTSPGVHINGVGSYLPEMREISEASIENASIVVIDDREGVETEAGEFMALAEAGKFSFDDTVELKDMIKYNIRREKEDDVTIFKSVGAAYYDTAVTIGAYEALNRK